jgi:hypothetical protein
MATRTVSGAGRLEGGGDGDGGWEELGEPGLFVMIWTRTA